MSDCTLCDTCIGNYISKFELSLGNTAAQKTKMEKLGKTEEFASVCVTVPSSDMKLVYLA